MPFCNSIKFQQIRIYLHPMHFHKVFFELFCFSTGFIIPQLAFIRVPLCNPIKFQQVRTYWFPMHFHIVPIEFPMCSHSILQCPSGHCNPNTFKKIPPPAIAISTLNMLSVMCAPYVACTLCMSCTMCVVHLVLATPCQGQPRGSAPAIANDHQWLPMTLSDH